MKLIDHLHAMLIALLLAGAAIAYFATVRAGHDWGGDFSMYLMNARNLVEGRPYAETGYIYDPAVSIGPRAYPPGYPALLAVPIAIHGLEIEAIKRYQIGFPIAFLAVFYVLARSRLNVGFSLGVTALAAASPMLWDIKERILSDVPFLMWLFITFAAANAADRRGWPRTRPIVSGLLLGCLAAACVATRTVGLVLIPALFLLDLWRMHSVRPATWLAVGLALATWALQAGTLQLEADYVRIAQTLGAASSQSAAPATFLGLDLASVPARILALPGDLSVFWAWANPGDPITVLPTALIGLAALGGLWVAWREGPALADMFAPVYLGALLVLPAGLGTESRLYLPLQAMLYLYAAVGLHAACTRFGKRLWGFSPTVVIVVLVVVSYQRSYAHLPFTSFHYGPLDVEATRAFRFIRENTPASARFAFSKPRVLALLADRSAGALPPAHTSGELMEHLARLDPDYLLVHKLLDRELIPLLAGAEIRWRIVYRSRNYVLFEVR